MQHLHTPHLQGKLAAFRSSWRRKPFGFVPLVGPVNLDATTVGLPK